MDYSFGLGLWKSLKNSLIVLIPALSAGWLAFAANLPSEYQLFVPFIGGFLAYLVKNYIQVKLE
jgi:hypothetical protein